jgi:FlaA1/EpsC-like NDP-sugar epimerase
MTHRFTEQELGLLLGRPLRASLTAEDRAGSSGRRVVITGGGGSIGSALARELAACRPARLALVDNSEYQLFQIEREVRRVAPGVSLGVHLADVTVSAEMRRVLTTEAPDVVYHAAACKHVTMAERAIAFAARVNVLGTGIVASAAAEAGARFVLISSDKAAGPRSVMGATKRLAELVTLGRANETFRPCVIRFGNVLGSSGSVLEIMRSAIRAGQPVPVTDPDATRYLMTPGEAVALVLLAERRASEAGIFWLDMGEPVRLGDLVDRMIALERTAGHVDAGIEIVGLRPGEKAHEQLLDPHLTLEPTSDPRIWRARHDAIASAIMDRALSQLQDAADRADDALALQVLADAVPGYRPSAQARAAAESNLTLTRTRQSVRRRDGKAA